MNIAIINIITLLLFANVEDTGTDFVDDILQKLPLEKKENEMMNLVAP